MISDLHKQIKDYEDTLRYYARKEMYIEEFAGYDLDTAVYCTKINPNNKAKKVLEKYGKGVDDER